MANNYPDLQGKTALIIGASRGIGVGIARVLGDQGMSLVLSGRSQEEGAKVEQSFTRMGYSVRYIAADLTKGEDAQRVLQFCGETPYLLVNNAALLRSKSILELDEEEMERSLLGNIRLFYYITHQTVRQMKEKGGGVVVNISSVGAQRAHRGTCGYDTYKGAMDSFTRTTAVELAPYNIRVNGVAPGATLNREGQALTNSKTGGIPLGRMGTQEDIGYAVAFLASEHSAYITGQTITVDGGLTAQLTPPGIYI